MTQSTERLSSALADRYRILSRLGEGGMATVYLAEDIKHKRQVAVKVLRPELAAVLGAERFVQEITTTASLQHPHILPLFDSGEADSFLYYVMPYIEGETLRAKLDRETQLGIDEAVKITTEVADALDYAHRQGIVHRDIKPENILLRDGRPMVADFGIALAVSAAAGGRMTETGLSLGTPHYMSPEQATAEKDITARSDVYSLGSVLYEMLAGAPPHLGGSAQQIIMKIIAEEVAPVTELRKAVPANVAAATAKALEKLPADRFGTAREFAEALENPAFTTRTVRLGAPTSRSTIRRAVLAGMLLGAVLGGAGVRLWSGGAAGISEPSREQLTFKGLARRPAIAPNGDFVAYVETSCEHAQLSLCRSSLLVQEVGSTQQQVLVRDAQSLGTPRWSHDGKTLVVQGQLDQERQGLFAIPRLSGTPQLIGSRGAYDTHPSADSVMLVPARPSGAGVALVIDLARGEIADSFPLPLDGANDISWAPDGRHVAVTGGNGFQVVNRDGLGTASVTTRNRRSIRWNLDGTALLFFRVGNGREDELVRVPVSRDGRVTGGAEVIMGRVPTLFRGEFDVARVTGQLAIVTGDAISDIWSFDLTSRPVRGHRETRGNTWYGYPAASGDGQTIYYYRGDALGDNVYLLDLATGVEEALTAQRLPGGVAMRLSADGRRLAYAHVTDSMTRLEYIEFPSRRVSGALAEIRPTRVAPVFPRGFLGTLSTNGALAVLDSVGGQWRSLPTADSLNIGDFAASPDGSRAVFAATLRRSARSANSFRPEAGTLPVVVGLISLTNGEVRVVRALEPGEPMPGLSWDRDGALYLSRWRVGDDLPSIWRLSLENGVLDRVADLPTACTPISVSVAALGRLAACTAEDYRSDVWLMNVQGMMP